MITKKKEYSWISKFKPGIKFIYNTKYLNEKSNYNNITFKCIDYPKFYLDWNSWTIKAIVISNSNVSENTIPLKINIGKNFIQNYIEIIK